MIPVLASAIGLVALVSWVVAALSLFRAITLVPKGKRLSALFSTGWWQFEKVRAMGGPEVDVHLQRYVWGFGAFFLAIFCGMALGAISMSMEKRSEVAVLASPSFHSPSVLES